MTKQNEISTSLYELLNGLNLEDKQHEAMMLLTVTEDQWPHTAMVSVGEVVALDTKRLRLALWPGTITAGNIVRSGQATLVAIHDGVAHYVRLRLSRLPELPLARHPRERFTAKVVAVREDTAKYADINSGVTITLKDPVDVLNRWRETILELQE
ncbi:hypothetical protein SAMN05661091_5514 [Paenibacillus uliginis N3/975]|uniref:Pyridoxamine 5'-phosphate oxidase n=1 Tax=Paenibacillus uliginis N3/975 TaxID=1313296 RepID=A0A1X7HSP1_9BACL|nr:pyridoxamine 5'-phosphate oxidase family protein [Paenibacillus uliginis]SMF91619.1 hypothetical protein SAMN05661091_5514 [Paenibacillus uliginis N3/975]